MKYYAPLFLILFSVNLLISQNNFNLDMGVTAGDLKATNYPADTTANALVIYDKGNTYVDKKTFFLSTTVERKIKIFNRNAFDYGTVEIPIFRDGSKKEHVHDIVATTTNLVNGSIVKTNLNPSNVYEENYNSKVNLIKFTLPNLQEGSVITYSYKKTSPFYFKYHPWEFQDAIPKLVSEYHSSIPANYEYNIRLVGSLPLTKNTQDIERSCIDVGNGLYADCSVSHYEMRNVPAFVEEDFMTAKENYLARIEYELSIYKSFNGNTQNFTKTWKIADNEIEGDTDLGRQMRRGGTVKNVLPKSIAAIANPHEKAQEIFYYVQDNYTVNDKRNLLYDVSIKNVLDEGSGTVSEINALLHNLLDQNELEVYPVLVSTRNNGLLTKLYPIISEFNYLLILAKINGKDYFLDASDKNLAFGEIPFKALNQHARMLDFKKGSEWINVEPENPSITQQRAELELNDEGLFEGTFKSRTSGYRSLDKRTAYAANADDYIEKNKRDYTNPVISNHEILDGDKKNAMFVESFDILYTPETIGEKIFVNPVMFKNFQANPFQLQERTYPIDFGFKDSFNYSAKLLFGDKYTLETLPEGKNFALPQNGGNLIFAANEIENGVEVVWKIDFKQAIYSPEFYPYIKKFISNLIDIQNNTLIVLKKK